MLPPTTVRTGLGKPRWDVLAFGHHPLQEGRGRREEGLWVLKPPQQAQGGDLVPLPSQCSSSGWGGEVIRPPGAIFACSGFQFPSGLCRQDSCDKFKKKETVFCVFM